MAAMAAMSEEEKVAVMSALSGEEKAQVEGEEVEAAEAKEKAGAEAEEKAKVEAELEAKAKAEAEEKASADEAAQAQATEAAAAAVAVAAAAETAPSPIKAEDAAGVTDSPARAAAAAPATPASSAAPASSAPATAKDSPFDLSMSEDAAVAPPGPQQPSAHSRALDAKLAACSKAILSEGGAKEGAIKAAIDALAECHAAEVSASTVEGAKRCNALRELCRLCI